MYNRFKRVKRMTVSWIQISYYFHRRCDMLLFQENLTSSFFCNIPFTMSYEKISLKINFIWERKYNWLKTRRQTLRFLQHNIFVLKLLVVQPRFTVSMLHQPLNNMKVKLLLDVEVWFTFFAFWQIQLFKKDWTILC